MRSFILSCVFAAACNDTTGSGLVTFTARAGGPKEAKKGSPFEFDTGACYHVSLRRASFHLGAIYLNSSKPISGGSEEPCVLPGIYAGQALGGCDPKKGCGVDIADLLSPDLVTFPMPGQGTAGQATDAEIWLTGGDINATDDSTPILDVEGTATCATTVACQKTCTSMQSWPFRATVTIGANRTIPAASPAMPGSNPICHQRIVGRIGIDFVLHDGGTLDLRVDPSAMWNGVDFATLPPPKDGGTYVIPDAPGGAGGALYSGVRSNGGVYQLTWTDPVH